MVGIASVEPRNSKQAAKVISELAKGKGADPHAIVDTEVVVLRQAASQAHTMEMSGVCWVLSVLFQHLYEV